MGEINWSHWDEGKGRGSWLNIPNQPGFPNSATVRTTYLCSKDTFETEILKDLCLKEKVWNRKILSWRVVSHSEKPGELGQEALREKAKGVWRAGKRLPTGRGLGSTACRVHSRRCPALSSCCRRRLSRFLQQSLCAGVFLQAFSSIQTAAQTFNRSSVAGATGLPHLHPSVLFQVQVLIETRRRRQDEFL